MKTKIEITIEHENINLMGLVNQAEGFYSLQFNASRSAFNVPFFFGLPPMLLRPRRLLYQSFSRLLHCKHGQKTGVVKEFGPTPIEGRPEISYYIYSVSLRTYCM
ncbi:hypothetical protein AKJ57_02715 [candidate division MSBL1 archaeon SCGC-AAA259A05]|uniref:Uncharacterized protein n=1 Tax=candidate division MSBL1 archaeon SCGC-AAA259A05 TaxID=1698259 RepID=A0A133UA02_9EURY|nr:hypothetical protein AKJ57_02715 [candidate division MSBL1 archaeon SCGC-AAA259A05]